MNNVSLTGNLTKDIEIRKTQTNQSVTSFIIGVRRDYKTNGEYESDFINCVAWGQCADFLGNYAHKGDKVEVIGSIQTRSYEKDGKKTYVTEVKADKVQVSAKPKELSDMATPSKHYETKEEPKNNEITIEPDDLPFY